jgi:hypothetical protein
MHNAAERARIRRQQEEEERNRIKERAKKKAEELAAKIEAQKADTEVAQVNSGRLFSSRPLTTRIRNPLRLLRKSPNLRGERPLLMRVPPGMGHLLTHRFLSDNSPQQIPSRHLQTRGEHMRPPYLHRPLQPSPNPDFILPTTLWTRCR